MLLAAVALLSSCAPPAPSTPDDERERLGERQGAFLAALGAQDLEAATAHFDEDALLHVAGMPPVQGRDAIRRFYGNVFRFMSASDATPETLHISAAADMAYGTGRVSNAFDSDAGPMEYTGKYLLVWEKVDGEWAIMVYAVSSDES